MIEVIEETLVDAVRLLPFLFIAYLIMEYIEHRTSKKVKDTIKKSGKFGPAVGSILGVFPQCGFSVCATNLYAARVITLGTLISVYLSTSDEMLPIFIAEAVPVQVILKILLVKLVIGMFSGFIIDFILRVFNKDIKEERILDLCNKEHCHCEHGILKSSLKHTINIFAFILIVSLIINIVIHFIGEDTIASFLQSKPIIGPIISGMIGMIPNCASSVIITQMYLENVISMGTLISGLLSGAGVGLVVLFKSNKGIRDNIKIVMILYGIGVISGILIELLGINF